MKTEIIYEDKNILVVRKPAGLASQTAKVGQQDVVSELKNYLRQPYLGIIHRLDQPVEGLLVFAKTKDAAAGLTAQLQKQGEGGTLHKRYYAVLCGKPSENEGRFVDYLCKDGSGTAIVTESAGESGTAGASESAGAPGAAGVSKGVGASGAAEAKKVAPFSNAKRSVLSYRILQTLDNPTELALADISIETGRFHQIRAQMAHHGYPLLGDAKYGDEKVQSQSRELGVKNVALCACYLEFVHPVSKKHMSFQIEPQGQAFLYFSFFSTHDFKKNYHTNLQERGRRLKGYGRENSKQ